MADVETSETLGKPSPVKFSSEVDRLGNARVGVYTVIDYKQHQDDGAFLVDKCENLFQTCQQLDAQGRLPELPQAVSALGDGAAQNGNGLKSTGSLKY